jgi:hypothetical protein
MSTYGGLLQCVTESDLRGHRGRISGKKLFELTSPVDDLVVLMSVSGQMIQRRRGQDHLGAQGRRLGSRDVNLEGRRQLPGVLRIDSADDQVAHRRGGTARPPVRQLGSVLVSHGDVHPELANLLDEARERRGHEELELVGDDVIAAIRAARHWHWADTGATRNHHAALATGSLGVVSRMHLP